MIEIIEKRNCSGCAACISICPSQCIEMRKDEEGFLYPAVKKTDCTNCGLCEKICPIKNTFFCAKEGYPDAELIYDKDVNWRKQSAAGGGFAGIARFFIEKYKGVVFGAAYDDNYNVHHISVEAIEDLKQLQKSKYIQSSMGDSFKRAKEYLTKDRYVLFSGTPCQIYGLKSYLGKMADNERLYTIDLSCHGVPSPKVFHEYLDTLTEIEHSSIAYFTMRDKRFKKNAYDQGFGVNFKNGTNRFISHSQDLFGRCFWGEIASRPSCYHCHFKTVWRCADITLGDCWFFNCYVPMEQDSFGVTLALEHSERGKRLLIENKYLVSYTVPAEELVKANGGMIYSSAKMNPQRNYFFEKLGQVPFQTLVNELFPIRSLSRKQKILNCLEKHGIRLEFLRKKSRMHKLSARLNAVIPDCAKGEMR